MEIAKEKKGIFCTVYFVRRKFFKHFCFISMYSALNILSEYILLPIRKHDFIHFFACFWNRRKPQCILDVEKSTNPVVFSHFVRKTSNEKFIFSPVLCQKQLWTGVLQNKCSWKNHRNAPVLESLFNRTEDSNKGAFLWNLQNF